MAQSGNIESHHGEPINNKNPFGVPGDYFSRLTEKILFRINNLPVKKESISAFEKKSPFIVPDDYFQQLPGRITSITEDKEEISGLSPFLSGVEKKNPFKVPDSYFETQHKELSLRKIPRKNKFKVPDNYFENLAYRIENRISTAKGARVIRFTSYFSKYKYSSLAIAAAIAALIALFIFSPDSSNIQKREMYVSAEDISNSLYLMHIDDATIADEIDVTGLPDEAENTEEIEDYLINHSVEEFIITDEF